jgi:hypothetical protein
MTATVQTRVQSLDWSAIDEALWRDGYAVTPRILDSIECSSLSSGFADDSAFRSHVVMSRFGFGRGEYKYYKYPVPRLVAELRKHFYPHLSAIANAWAKETGGEPLPEVLSDYLETCHAAGQQKPTPLLLKYQPGDFNCLHQDVYGEIVFPFQMTFFLNQPGKDYAGGEFVLVEQRPRMQSRARVIQPESGQAVIFPTRYRLVRGSRGIYRASLRHGVSELRSGQRYTLGVIFHDAK